MRRVVVSEFLTLDGVMQAPGGPDEDRSGGFEHGGWQAGYFNEDMGRAVDAAFSASDGLLLGRRTYEIFAAYWPHATEDVEFAERINNIAKYVVSNTLHELEWNNSTLISGDVVGRIRELKQQPGKDLNVIGSGELAQTLIANDLVDEYVLMFHPIVLGSGKRLFREGTALTRLQLIESKATSTGVTIATYRPAEPA